MFHAFLFCIQKAFFYVCEACASLFYICLVVKSHLILDIITNYVYN